MAALSDEDCATCVIATKWTYSTAFDVGSLFFDAECSDCSPFFDADCCSDCSTFSDASCLSSYCCNFLSDDDAASVLRELQPLIDRGCD